MTPGDDGAPSSAADRLAAAIREEPGLTVRGFARELVEPGATRDQIDNKRRQINGWKAGKGISDENAEMLARRFGKPLDYFKTPKPTRQRRREEIDALREELSKLAARVEELEQERQHGHEGHRQEI